MRLLLAGTHVPSTSACNPCACSAPTYLHWVAQLQQHPPLGSTPLWTALSPTQWGRFLTPSWPAAHPAPCCEAGSGRRHRPRNQAAPGPPRWGSPGTAGEQYRCTMLACPQLCHARYGHASKHVPGAHGKNQGLPGFRQIQCCFMLKADATAGPGELQAAVRLALLIVIANYLFTFLRKHLTYVSEWAD